MKLSFTPSLACPLDGLPLQADDGRKHYYCKNNHNFDAAKQGYINLLSVQDKRSKDPGDSKDMVIARQRFLDSGSYQSISDVLNDIVVEHAAVLDRDYHVFDAGCGEGYYLNRLTQALQGAPCGNKAVCSAIGVDISKHAIQAATRRNRKDITWVVGTNRKPPILRNGVTCILSMFGYPVYNAFSPLLSEDGIIILVEPGQEHLIELREVLYDDVKKGGSLPSLQSAYDVGFVMKDSRQYRGRTAVLSNALINDLLIMTPHFFKAKAENRVRAMALDDINVTIDVHFRILTVDSRK